MANFKPEQNEYKNLTPFKMWLVNQINTWGCSNFPFLESDFDKLTNYAMMMKLMKAMNKVISNENKVEEDMTNLFNAFTELQNYINTYFENLDVQDEINNKLDDMAQSGELTDLLSVVVQNEIMPLINEQNQNISDIEDTVDLQNQNIRTISNKVNSVTSGSPAGVYATKAALESADPDHSKIYVVSADGKWYYYDTNESAWTEGGVYLSSSESVNDINGNNIFLSNTNGKNKSLFITYGYIYGRDGVKTTNGNWACTVKIPVVPGDTIVIETGIQDYLTTWDEDGAFIGYKNVASSTDNISYTVESGVYYIGFNIYKDNFSKDITLNGNSIYSLYNINWLNQNDKSIQPEQINTLHDKVIDKLRYLVAGSYWNNQGEIVNSSSWLRSKYKIPVKVNDTINIENARGLTMIIFDDDDNIIQAYEHTMTLNNFTYVLSTNASDAAYIKFNVVATDLENYDLKINGRSIFNTYALEWLTVNEENLSDEIKDLFTQSTYNKWYNKDSVMYGDSIVAGSPGTTPYATILKNSLKLSHSANEGVSGRPIADGTINGSGTVTTVENTIANYADYNLVIIAGGTNDFKLNVPLGNILTVESTFNRNEFTGAYQHLIENIIATNPTIRIVLMTPLQRNNSGYDIYHTNTAGFKLIDYCNRIKELGQLYSLPVIDMYSNSGMNMLNLSSYTLDGLHPSTDGYVLLTDYLSHQLINL